MKQEKMMMIRYLEWNWMFICSTSDIYIDFLIIRFAEWYDMIRYDDDDNNDDDDCYYFNKYSIIMKILE